MRYLRMLSNSAFGGLLAAVYLTLLMLHLNPGVPLTTGAVLPLALTLLLSYGVHVAVLLYVAYVVRQLFGSEPISPGWISLRLLTWSAALLAGVASLLSWLNASGFRTALDAGTVTALTRAALAWGICAAAFLLLAVAHATTRQRAPAVIAWVFVPVVALSIAMPLWLRGAPSALLPPDLLPARRIDVGDMQPARTPPRVFLILLGGASLDVISPAVAEGRLPQFGRLLEGGASLHLATVRPTQPEPVWATVVTGKWPPKHGIRSSAAYRSAAGGAAVDLLPDHAFMQALLRFGFMTEEPHAASALRARPLWQMLSSYGVPSGVIGVPLTQPPDPIRGFIVSDQFQRSGDPDVDLTERSPVYPPELELTARESLRAGRESSGDAASRLPRPPAPGEADALSADRITHDLAGRLPAARDVRLLVVRYQGIDALGHYYLRYAMPQAFGDVSEDERRDFGRVLDDYYAYIDTVLGTAIASLRDDDLLLVASGFGMEPLSPRQRLLERLAGNPRFSGTHERGPDGFLLAYGAAVTAGRASRGAVVDITPTILYFLGLPVARDMDGFARTDLFTRAFNAQRTITFIPSYD